MRKIYFFIICLQFGAVVYSQKTNFKVVHWILNLKENCKIVDEYNAKYRNRIIKTGNSFKLISNNYEILSIPKADSVYGETFNDKSFLKLKKGNSEIIWFEESNYVMPYLYESMNIISYNDDLFKRCFIVKKNNKWGIINYKNEIVIPIQYDKLKVGQYYIYDKDSATVPILIAQKNNKTGVIDLENNILLDYNYSSIDQIYPTIYKCIKDSIELIINIKGNQFYSSQIKYWYPDNNRIVVDRGEDRFIFNRSGDLQLPIEKNKDNDQEKKKIPEFIRQSGRYIIYDSIGKPLTSDSIFDFKKVGKEYYIVKLNTANGRLKGIISARNGSIVLKPEYIDIIQFNTDSLIFKAIKKDFSEYIINSRFNEIRIPGSYKYLEVNGPRFIKFSNNNPGFGVIDLIEEKVLLPFTTEEFYGYIDGFYVHASREKGAELLDLNFNKLGLNADNFFTFGDLLFANNWKKNEIGMNSRIYNKKDLKIVYDSIIKYNTEVNFVTIQMQDGINIILDKLFEVYGKIPYEIQEFESNNNGEFIFIKNQEKKGIYSIWDKKIILEPIYDNITHIDKSLFIVKKGSSLGIICYQ